MSDVIDLAAGVRIVRTKAGSLRYKAPIGAVIRRQKDGSWKPATRASGSARLSGLKAQAAAGDATAAKKVRAITAKNRSAGGKKAAGTRQANKVKLTQPSTDWKTVPDEKLREIAGRDTAGTRDPMGKLVLQKGLDPKSIQNRNDADAEDARHDKAIMEARAELARRRAAGAAQRKALIEKYTLGTKPASGNFKKPAAPPQKRAAVAGIKAPGAYRAGLEKQTVSGAGVSIVPRKRQVAAPQKRAAVAGIRAPGAYRAGLEKQTISGAGVSITRRRKKTKSLSTVRLKDDVELARRRRSPGVVRTAEGSKRYGVPIGTPIAAAKALRKASSASVMEKIDKAIDTPASTKTVDTGALSAALGKKFLGGSGKVTPRPQSVTSSPRIGGLTVTAGTRGGKALYVENGKGILGSPGMGNHKLAIGDDGSGKPYFDPDKLPSLHGVRVVRMSQDSRENVVARQGLSRDARDGGPIDKVLETAAPTDAFWEDLSKASPLMKRLAPVVRKQYEKSKKIAAETADLAEAPKKEKLSFKEVVKDIVHTGIGWMVAGGIHYAITILGGLLFPAMAAH